MKFTRKEDGSIEGISTMGDFMNEDNEMDPPRVYESMEAELADIGDDTPDGMRAGLTKQIKEKWRKKTGK